MSKSGLYAYFTSKQDLQLATIDCAWQVFDEHVLQPDHDTVQPLVSRWISYYEREVFPGGCLFVTIGMEFANRAGPVHDAIAAAIERQVAALEHAVTRALGDDTLPATTDPGQLAFELHALLTTSNQRFRLSRDPAVFSRARTAIARLISRTP